MSARDELAELIGTLIKYIVTVENQYTQTGTLAKLDPTGKYYQEIGRGTYSDMLDIARQLNNGAGR